MTCSIADSRKLKTSDFDGFFFTGKQWDEDEQLYYFNARWYDPETGRFITEDPVKDGLLWFAYVNNNPMGFVDPTGMYGEGPSEEYLKSLGASSDEAKDIASRSSGASNSSDIPSILPPFTPSERPKDGTGYWYLEKQYEKYYGKDEKVLQTHPDIQRTPNNPNDKDANLNACYIMSLLGASQTILNTTFDTAYVNKILDYGIEQGFFSDNLNHVNVSAVEIINTILGANNSEYRVGEVKHNKNITSPDITIFAGWTENEGPHYREGNSVNIETYNPDPSVKLKDYNVYSIDLYLYKPLILNMGKL